jgi:hypothetical protein
MVMENNAPNHLSMNIIKGLLIQKTDADKPVVSSVQALVLLRITSGGACRDRATETESEHRGEGNRVRRPGRWLELVSPRPDLAAP